MKFFLQKNNVKKPLVLFTQLKYNNKNTTSKANNQNHIFEFSRFFLKNGLMVKSKTLFSGVIKNFNSFIYTNNFYIYENHPNVK